MLCVAGQVWPPPRRSTLLVYSYVMLTDDGAKRTSRIRVGDPAADAQRHRRPPRLQGLTSRRKAGRAHRRMLIQSPSTSPHCRPAISAGPNPRKHERAKASCVLQGVAPLRELTVVCPVVLFFSQSLAERCLRTGLPFTISVT